MRPTAIPEDLVNADRVRQTVTVPEEIAEHVDPVEALIQRGPGGLAKISMRIEIDPEDFRSMASSGELWVTFLGGVTPFLVSTELPGEG